VDVLADGYLPVGCRPRIFDLYEKQKRRVEEAQRMQDQVLTTLRPKASMVDLGILQKVQERQGLRLDTLGGGRRLVSEKYRFRPGGEGIGEKCW